MNQLSYKATNSGGMTLYHLETLIERAKSLGVDGNSIVRVESKVEWNISARGLPLTQVHFEMEG